MNNLNLLGSPSLNSLILDKEVEFQLKRLTSSNNSNLYISDTDSEDGGPPVRPAKRPKRVNKQEGQEEEKEKDSDRIIFQDQEIFRLQNLCRENFGVIDSLRKQNSKLIEIQSELKDTTTDLAYSLAECPWWKEDEYRNAAFRILTSFTQNIQYILQLPAFIDPVEQLQVYGLSKEKAIRYLRRKSKINQHSTKAVFKCQKCKKIFTSECRFQTHNLMHSGQKKLGCKRCSITFSTFLQFKEHKNQHVTQSQGSESGNIASPNCTPNISSSLRAESLEPQCQKNNTDVFADANDSLIDKEIRDTVTSLVQNNFDDSGPAKL